MKRWKTAGIVFPPFCGASDLLPTASLSVGPTGKKSTLVNTTESFRRLTAQTRPVAVPNKHVGEEPGLCVSAQVTGGDVGVSDRPGRRAETHL